VVTNNKLGQFKLDYEEYQKLKVMLQFINTDYSFININIKLMKAHFALNTRSEYQKCVLVPQLIFSHSLKQTIMLTFDKLCINLIEFDHFATDFAKNIS
jgi:hypothetical protein